MSLGTNLAYLRKEKAITQERLAEMMSVSRQTVSRWESDSVLPDVDTLIRLCDIFGCDLDSLVRGDVTTKADGECDSEVSYDTAIAQTRSLFKRLALLVALGVFIIISGVSAMLFVLGYTGNEIYGTITLLAFVALGTGALVYSGISHAIKTKDIPRIPLDSYKKDHFFRLSPWLFSIAIVFLILNVIMLIWLLYGSVANNIQHRIFGWFMLIIAICVSMIVYTGVRISEEGFVTERALELCEGGKEKKLLEAINSSIMMVATIVFLLLGLLKNLWHPAWVAFPIGGILTGIVSAIFGAVSGASKD
ncbi:MAG: helix-turn-helix transcriptional regulator [Clostridia bacterium]|nr:helix-turn-helix transcriptional regulator [Clostridia bacterium]